MRIWLLASVFVISLSAPSWAAGPMAPSQTGRYVIVHSPQNERDTMLLDTQTGRTWIRKTITNLTGDPFIWEPIVQVNSDADWLALARQHPPKPAATPPAPGPVKP